MGRPHIMVGWFHTLVYTVECRLFKFFFHDFLDNCFSQDCCYGKDRWIKMTRTIAVFCIITNNIILIF